MPAIDSWTLDGVALTSGAFTLMEVQVDPPPTRPEWTSGADSEGAALMRQPLHDNRTITMKLRVAAQASMDAALDQVGALIDKVRKASNGTSGITLVWTPGGSARTGTFDVLAAVVTGLPIALQGDGYSWLLQRPIVTVEMTGKPHGRLTPLATVTDAFASNSIADYTFDAGIATNVLITGGVMDAVANLTTENRLLHTASPYTVANARLTAKHTLGTTLTSYKAGVILKRLDASNYLEVYVDDTGAASRLRIDRVIAGSRTNLASTALTRMTVSTAYWVRGRIEGNVVFAEHWTSAPTVTGSATSSGTATLAGGDATTLGSGVSGRTGLVWTPQQTAATLDDFEMAPNVFVSATPFVTGELVNPFGDIPALATVTVIESASQSRRHVEWGLEGPLTYSASTSLLVDSDSLVTSGFAGSQVTTSGAYDPNASGNNSISASLFANTQTAVCGTGNLSHVGVFRVKARVQFASDQDYARLSWRALDGPTSANDWVFQQSAGGWEEIDLGTIAIPVASSGTQRWTGQIESYTTRGGGSSIIVDYLTLVPAGDGYGKARATFTSKPGVVVGYDDFTGTTAAAALNARVGIAGGTWATSGDATDYVFADAPTASEETVTRSAISGTAGRIALLGTSTPTDVQVQARIYNGNLPGVGVLDMAVVARYVDSSNYLYCTFRRTADSLLPLVKTLEIRQVIAGVDTQIAATASYPGATTARWWTIDLTVYATGAALARVLSPAGAEILSVAASSTVLATSGTLASGKSGLLDRNTSTSVFARYYDGFTIFTPAAEAIALYSGRTMQIRYDDVERQDSTGTYVGRPPSYRGSRFLLPVGTSRVLVKARRNDIEAAVDDQVTDSTTIQVVWTPRFLSVPRN